MVMNEAVPRLSAEPFSGIMGILESAAIECLSINVEPITIEKLSSESLYSRGGRKEAGNFYPLLVCGKRGDVPQVGRFQISLISGERIARHYRRPQRNERRPPLFIRKTPSS